MSNVSNNVFSRGLVVTFFSCCDVVNTSFICPFDVCRIVLNFYEIFDVSKSKKRFTFKVPTFEWPLCMAVFNDRHFLVADNNRKCIHVFDLEGLSGEACIPIDQDDDAIPELKFVREVKVDVGNGNSPSFIATCGTLVAITSKTVCTVYNVTDVSNCDKFEEYKSFHSDGTSNQEMYGLIFLNPHQIALCMAKMLALLDVELGTMEVHPLSSSCQDADPCDVCIHPRNPDLLLVTDFGTPRLLVFSVVTKCFVDVIDFTKYSPNIAGSLGLNGITRISSDQVVVMCMGTRTVIQLKDWDDTDVKPKGFEVIEWVPGVRVLYHNHRLYTSQTFPPVVVIHE